MFELPARALQLRDQVERFFNTRVLPNNQLWHAQASTGVAEPEIERQLKS